MHLEPLNSLILQWFWILKRAWTAGFEFATIGCEKISVYLLEFIKIHDKTGFSCGIEVATGLGFCNRPQKCTGQSRLPLLVSC